MSFPHPGDLPRPPLGIVWHWSAGSHTASVTDERSYHLLLEHLEGGMADPTSDRLNWRAGVPVERNMRMNLAQFPTAVQDPAHGYAAHVRRWNSRRIGIAACAMRGAVDYRPTGSVYPGDQPLTLLQVRGLISAAVQACRIYGWEPTAAHVCTHWEVEHIHGVPQNQRWNLTWLPHLPEMPRADVGPYLREQVHRWIRGEDIDPLIYAPPRGEVIGEQVAGMEG